jgi:hypothetical protein
VQASSGGHIHKGIDAELAIPATQQILEARLCNAEALDGLRLRHAQRSLADFGHQKGSEHQDLCFGLREAKISEDVPTASLNFYPTGHLPILRDLRLCVPECSPQLNIVHAYANKHIGMSKTTGCVTIYVASACDMNVT